MKTPNERSERLAVNAKEAAALLAVSQRLLWTWTNAGQIPHVRLGRRVLYPVDELRKWLSEQACTRPM